MILGLILIPLLLTALPFVLKDIRCAGRANAAGHAVVLLFAFLASYRLAFGTPLSYFDFFYADALSGFFMLVIAIVNFASALYSTAFIERDIRDAVLSGRKARLYYLLFNLFAFSMFMVVVLNNMGYVWVAIEMTTLVSAFLVGFYNDKKSVEAAWKYLMLCSVGITLALLGTILFYYTLSTHGGIKSLNWTDMYASAANLDKNVLKIAFLFILAGYGTKAGLAPMHTWLPDAHSQAPAPISALLSGVLLKTSLYAIMRYLVVVNTAVGTAFAGKLLIMFGLISLGIAAGFILVQKDLKRLLAYSSIEHVGIVAVGLGVGGPLGFLGALFHILNHAVTKSMMFFGAGEIVKHYGTHNMNMIRGAGRALPFTGVIAMAGAFALAGSPPFSIFFSEITVLVAAFSSAHYFAGTLFLAFLAVIFGGIIYHFGRIVFGRMPDDIAPAATPLSTKISLLFLSVFVLLSGFALPGVVKQLLLSAAKVLR